MQTSLAIAEPREHKAESVRACVHDLRNLFAVVASARHLLDRPFDKRTRSIVLEALHRVATDGKILTDGLLSGGLEDHACGTDASAEMHELAPLLQAFEARELDIDLSIDDEPTWVLMAPTEFRAVVLELVTNAAKAGARIIRIRAKRGGCRFWLTVGDDGSGFAEPAAGPEASTLAGLHGTGMLRLSAAVGSARGKVRIRSQRGRGSAVAVVLPIIRLLPPVQPLEMHSKEAGGTGMPEMTHG
jgi:two-component sensor histidine kinase